MKNLLVYTALLVIVAQSAYAGCCFINDTASKCTYWDLDSMANQKDFCHIFTNFGMSTDWKDQSCDQYTKDTGCVDGFTSGNTVVKDAIQKQMSSGGGGGGACTADWKCTEWSSCLNGFETRTCSATHKCGTASPETRKSCTENHVAAVGTTSVESAANDSTTLVNVTTVASTEQLTGNEPALTDSLAGTVGGTQDMSWIYLLGAVGAVAAGGAIFLGYVLSRR